MNSVKFTLISGMLMGAAAANAQTVYSNNLDPGDYFTNAGSTPANQMVTGFTGTGGEKVTYRETKNGATVGINTTAPRNGNGSVWFSANGTNVKSEIAMSTGFDGAGNSAGTLGAFDSMTTLSADLMTLSSSVSNQAPIVRIELFSSTQAAGHRYGQLVFDTAWSPAHYGTFNFGTWNNVSLFANSSSTYLRGTSSLGLDYDPSSAEMTLANWQSTLAGKGFEVISVNAGIGTFNGSFEGGMDNLSVGFGGNTKNYNFEAVPEPTSICALGLGALALIRRRSAKK